VSNHLLYKNGGFFQKKRNYIFLTMCMKVLPSSLC